MKPTLDKIGKKDLLEFTDIFAEVCEFDKEWFVEEALQAKAYYGSSKVLRKNLYSFQKLETQWYHSLENNNPDYSLYSSIDIIPDLWACWVVYSRAYLKAITSEKSLGEKDENNNWVKLKSIKDDIGSAKSIVDVGCGIGYTTMTLKELFPDASVFGTNMKGSPQYALNELLSHSLTRGFYLRENISLISARNVDVIFASEYFEHFQKPIDHLMEMITHLNPRTMLIANAFGTQSMGHFNTYIYNSQNYTGKQISRIFNKTMKEFGYSKIKTNCWNNRPNYWKKAT